jgi:hypothetical protein
MCWLKTIEFIGHSVIGHWLLVIEPKQRTLQFSCPESAWADLAFVDHLSFEDIAEDLVFNRGGFQILLMFFKQLLMLEDGIRGEILALD